MFYRKAIVGKGGGKPIPDEWFRFVYPINDLPAEGRSELRVRFDLLGPGEVCIDDVTLYDLKFEDAERVALTKLIALADAKLQSKKLADCARLLDGYWPHFLLAHVPFTEKELPIARRPEPVVDPPKKPGRIEQMRDYLRRLW